MNIGQESRSTVPMQVIWSHWKTRDPLTARGRCTHTTIIRPSPRHWSGWEIATCWRSR